MKSLRISALSVALLAFILLVASVAMEAAAPDSELVVAGSYTAWLAGAGGVLAAFTTLLGILARRSCVLLNAGRDEAVRAVAQTEHRMRKEADDERARLLGRIDHELKNPLAALQISLHTASAQEPATFDKALASAADQSERIATVLRDMRKIADVQSRELDLERVDVAEILDEVRAMALEADPSAATSRRWSVQVQTAPWPLPAVTADAGLLFLALANLVENAIKYSAEGDLIELRAVDRDDSVVIEVADTGIGIPPEDQVEVWREFARARSTAHLPGGGLGLPLVAAVAARHGGQVGLRSREGSGTVMRFSIPVAGPTAV